MGNEMGNQNVSGLQVEEPMEPDTPAKASEAALLSSHLESLRVKKVSVPTLDSDNVHGNGNQSSPDLANVSEVDGSHIQDQAPTGRDNSATANSGNRVEILLLPSHLDGGEKERISVLPLEAEDLHTNFENPDTTNSHESGNHLIQNEASTGRGQEHEISMESERKKNCDQKSSVDSCSAPSIQRSSVVLVSKGDVIQSNGSFHFGENNNETDGVEQMDTKSISLLRDVKIDGDGEEIQAEMDVSRTKTTELAPNGSLESFYLEAIDCDVKGVFLGDGTGAVGMGAELKMNVHGRGSVLVSQEDGKVSVDALESFYLDAIESEIKAVCLGDDLHAIGMGDEMNTIYEENREVLIDKSNIDKNDMLQTDNAAIETEKEKKPLNNDEINDFGIENSLQADNGEQTESGQQIKLHDGGGLISEKDVEEGLDNEREDTDNSLLLSLPLADSIGASKMEEREDADPKGEESEDLWSDTVKNELEQDSNLNFDGGSMNEEILRPVLPQPESLKQETDFVLPILIPLEKQQEPVTENGETETKTLEPRQTLEQESCLDVHSGEGFGNSAGNPLSETSEPTSELGPDESQFADGSLNENGVVSTAISQSLSQEEELSPSLTKFLGDNEQKTHSETPANGEMPSTKLSQANFDSSEMHTTDSDLEDSLVETEVSALKTQTENIESLSHCKDEWAAHGVNGLCEKDKENQDIQLHASDSPSIKVSEPQMKNGGETGNEEPLSDEENRKYQETLGRESHLSETTPFDSSPSAGKSSISALEASPALPDHEASASESWEEVQENHIIQIGMSESPESDFALPPANAEVSVVETKIEEFEQKIMLQQASTAKDEASQALENNEKSVTASHHEEESATKHLHSTCSCTDSKIQTTETELQILKPTKDESSSEAEPVEKKVFALERSNSEKLKTPLSNSVKEETHVGEPLQNQASLPEKKIVKEDWGSPKKEITTSAKGRGKPKSRYSLFSHCMCCTTVIQ
ncbi:hypothetical protein ACLOJK_032775 [Asimina triloba]